ncbi:hypothetical protein ACIRRA_45895, partial [Nocardia sp. NPDC101769]|uniref:hypothetical protein n=1 Tax=Nocardia sp. NPDC101769 TaxID=3364333 RepID=UPI003818DF46
VPSHLKPCPQCAPEWSAADARAVPLRALSGPQLAALHVTSLDDDGFRHFLPRVLEVVLLVPSPTFDLGLSRSKGRAAGWKATEAAAVRELAAIVWREVLGSYPASVGYVSDSPSLLQFVDWWDLPLPRLLGDWLRMPGLSPVRHLADLACHVWTTRDPFEPEARAAVLSWLRDDAVGDRLQSTFFATDSDQAAAQLSAAYELWTTCHRPGDAGGPTRPR